MVFLSKCSYTSCKAQPWNFGLIRDIFPHCLKCLQFITKAKILLYHYIFETMGLRIIEGDQEDLIDMRGGNFGNIIVLSSLN